MHKFGPNNNDNRGGRQLGGGVGIKFREWGAASGYNATCHRILRRTFYRTSSADVWRVER